MDKSEKELIACITIVLLIGITFDVISYNILNKKYTHS